MVYQTFDAARPGDSDSAGKWAALRVSDEFWRGKRVLDLGCNEGYFCRKAMNAGAAHVVGVDRDHAAISLASEICPEADFVHARWMDAIPGLAPGFDVMLLLSAMHYESEPEKLLRIMATWLDVHGLIILECGIAPGGEHRWVKSRRPNSTVSFPTMPLMYGLLKRAGLVGRWMGRSVDQKGDQTPRHVFHCYERKQQMLIVSGPSRSGKTTLARELSPHPFFVDSHLRDHPDEAPTDGASLQPKFEEIAHSMDRLSKFVDSIIDCLPNGSPADSVIVVDCIDLISGELAVRANACGYRVSMVNLTG